jgi:hypothetical protein
MNHRTVAFVCGLMPPSFCQNSIFCFQVLYSLLLEKLRNTIILSSSFSFAFDDSCQGRRHQPSNKELSHAQMCSRFYVNYQSREPVEKSRSLLKLRREMHSLGVMTFFPPIFGSPSLYVIICARKQTQKNGDEVRSFVSNTVISDMLELSRKVRQSHYAGSPSSPVQDELIENFLSFAIRFQSRVRFFRILLMRFLHGR